MVELKTVNFAVSGSNPDGGVECIDCTHYGVLAQLVEHLLCKQKVRGSMPLDSIVQEDEKSDVSDRVSITLISITWGCQVSTEHKGLIC